MPTKKVRKQCFIERLARYLVEGQATKSIELEMGLPAAKDWAALRHLTPLVGYPDLGEAVRILEEFLE